MKRVLSKITVLLLALLLIALSCVVSSCNNKQSDVAQGNAASSSAVQGDTAQSSIAQGDIAQGDNSQSNAQDDDAKNAGILYSYSLLLPESLRNKCIEALNTLDDYIYNRVSGKYCYFVLTETQREVQNAVSSFTDINGNVREDLTETDAEIGIFLDGFSMYLTGCIGHFAIDIYGSANTFDTNPEYLISSRNNMAVALGYPEIEWP